MLRMLFLAASLATSAAAADLFQGAPCWIQDAASAGERVWLLCDREDVLLGRVNGARWQTVKLPVADEKLRSILFVDENKGFIVGDNGTLLVSRDGGKSWSRVAVPTKENLRAIHFVGPDGWIAGYGGVVLKSSDGGQSWELQRTGITLALDAIYFVDAQYGWAVGWNGTIIRTTNGGQSWKLVTNANAMWSLSSVYFKDRDTGWVVGMFGQILHTTDGGETWRMLEAPVRSWFTAVTFDKRGRGWITTENDLLVSEDKGLKWRPIGYGEPLFLERLVAVGDAVWAVGPFGILRQDGQELSWRKVEFARDVS